MKINPNIGRADQVRRVGTGLALLIATAAGAIGLWVFRRRRAALDRSFAGLSALLRAGCEHLLGEAPGPNKRQCSQAQAIVGTVR